MQDKKTITLTIQVIAPSSASDESVCKSVEKLIDIGLADAVATVEDKDGDLEDANFALALDIKAPQVWSAA